MSTKSTIKSQERTATEPGYHLYEDVIEQLALGATAGTDTPVYLELDGVDVELEASAQGGVSVTVKIPRALAIKLGLVPRYRLEDLMAECRPEDDDA